MISIKLPIKVLKENSQEERESIEKKVYSILDIWFLDNPSFKNENINIVWGTYFDIHGKGLPDSSPQRIGLFKTIKAVL